MEQDLPERRRIVVDGSNIATEGRTLPSLAQLDEAIRAFLEEYRGFTTSDITVVVDASFGHRIDPSEVAAFDQAVEHGEMISPPAGAVGRGDGFILRIAEKSGALVLSNDSFQEFHAERPWLFESGRLIGGKPVPGVGWIFTPRTPVRGARSRSVTSKSKRDERAAEIGRDLATGDHHDPSDLEPETPRRGRGNKATKAAKAAKVAKAEKADKDPKPDKAAKAVKAAPTAKAAKSGRSARSAAPVAAAADEPLDDAKPSRASKSAKSASLAKPAKSAKPAKAAKKSRAVEQVDDDDDEANGATSTRATKAAKAGKATKTAKAAKTGSATKAARGTRTRRGTSDQDDLDAEFAPKSAIDPSDADGSVRPRSTSEALNEPMTFLTFVANHPVGSTFDGTVVSFTSHGAHVDVEGMLCHVPLRGLGHPAPNKARQVLTKGETRRFELVSLDAARRRAELALPGFGP